MFTILHALGMLLTDLFKSRTRLEAENLFLRHQLKIALRRAPPRLRLRGSDRALLILMTMLWPRLLDAAQLVQPETVLRWHRAGFKAFWRWKSRNRVGRPNYLAPLSAFRSWLDCITNTSGYDFRKGQVSALVISGHSDCRGHVR